MMSGVAFVSATAIVAAVPSDVSGTGLGIPGLPAPVTVSNAKVELAALADVTISGLIKAYWSGWGGYIGTGNGTPDVYYPNINATGTNGVYVTGISGVAYYITDEALAQFGAINLDNYYFEVGSYYGRKSSPGSGISALIYVGTSEVFGTTSPVAQLAKAIFYYGVPSLTTATIVQLAEQLPTVAIGPLKVGAGILTSLYFTGQTPSGNFSYGSTGLSAIAAYLATSITSVLPAASTAAANKAPAAASNAPLSTAGAKATSGVGSPKIPASAASATPSTPSTTKSSATVTITKPADQSPASKIAGKVADALGIGKAKSSHS
jgi:hypothetical protein